MWFLFKGELPYEKLQWHSRYLLYVDLISQVTNVFISIGVLPGPSFLSGWTQLFWHVIKIYYFNKVQQQKQNQKQNFRKDTLPFFT